MKKYTIQSSEFGSIIYAADLPGEFPITDKKSEAAIFGDDNIQMKARHWSALYGYKFEAVLCEC